MKQNREPMECYTPLQEAWIYSKSNGKPQEGLSGKEVIGLIFFFFETEFRSCYPGWSAMA